MAVNTAGSVIAFVPSGEVASEGEAHIPQPGYTVEYNVPVSGAGAPYNMSSTELEKWGQKTDDPMEASAIVVADEPQGWPASSYKRASVFYMDSANRVVNVASPGGGISTTEYNKTNNNVERTLSADNREAALKEGGKSAEVAQLLSTDSTYNTLGTELTTVQGPQHTVKLPNGEPVAARKTRPSNTNRKRQPGVRMIWSRPRPKVRLSGAVTSKMCVRSRPSMAARKISGGSCTSRRPRRHSTTARN